MKDGDGGTMIDGFYRAMGLMRRPDAYLLQTNGRRPQWWIAPYGERVEPQVAEQIKAHPQVKGDEAGLWPGLSQTWRMQ